MYCLPSRKLPDNFKVEQLQCLSRGDIFINVSGYRLEHVRGMCFGNLFGRRGDGLLV